MLFTNLWQVWRTRSHSHRALAFWPLALTMTLGIVGFSLIAPSVSISGVTLILGITVLVFAAVSLWREIPQLSPRYDKPAQVTAGLTSGLMGGLTGVWAPPIIVYMSAMRVDKTTFVAVIGVLLSIGSAALAVSYQSNGLLTQEQAIASLLLIIPAVLGFSVGEKLRDSLDEERFRRWVLIFFLLMGANLIRKAVF